MMRNLITDVPGILVGHAHDPGLGSGVTAVILDPPAVASAAVIGGAPGTRETDLLAPDAAVEAVDAIALSGGSAFGLDAAAGIQAWARERGRGFAIGPVRVPIVPAAICFDLLNGGDKNWGRHPPYRELGFAAAEAAAVDFSLGSVGAGYGATTVDLKGGVGSASAVLPSGHRVGALAVVNALGSALANEGPHFLAAPYEVEDEFGGLGLPPDLRLRAPRWKGGAQPATTLAVVATDAVLTKAQARRLAFAAQGGLARSLTVAHALLDGDTVFTVATGRRGLDGGASDLVAIGAAAAACLARAVARGVYEARSWPGSIPSWSERFGSPGRNGA
ncbi:P1 family peptidase [Salinarimonas soli]|uniref:P1 family peptidase n=1 Tax=Salinarimonas soli TaxID=1638099 RepID=A0A5B2VBV1_9HYPH|nr:P1 family peptidase [Salinarimonas soli]KAA2236165.1 P1 family peptidase [Salinarimonas soli]